MKDLRQAAGVKLGLPTNRWMLVCGAIAMQTETELLLKRRRVSPAKLLQSGFLFRFPHLPEAAYELVQRWRTG
jgi:NAD dependent epimerase/dehydratase family enzyme